MRIDIISAVPDILESPLNYSIIKRAREKKLVDINIINSTRLRTRKSTVKLDITLSEEMQVWLLCV